MRFKNDLSTSVTTKTSEVHRGGGSSRPGTCTVSVWCPDRQRRSLLDSVSLQRLVTPGDCPPRVSACLCTSFHRYNYNNNLDVFCSVALKHSNKTKVKSTCRTKHHTWVQEPSDMSLVLSDTVTAALQSSMRRWMTVLTTCIWIGFKVSYAPLKALGLLALCVLWLYIYSLLVTWSLPTTVLL